MDTLDCVIVKRMVDTLSPEILKLIISFDEIVKVRGVCIFILEHRQYETYYADRKDDIAKELDENSRNFLIDKIDTYNHLLDALEGSNEKSPRKYVVREVSSSRNVSMTEGEDLLKEDALSEKNSVRVGKPIKEMTSLEYEAYVRNNADNLNKESFNLVTNWKSISEAGKELNNTLGEELIKANNKDTFKEAMKSCKKLQKEIEEGMVEVEYE